MLMISDDERRKVAEQLREFSHFGINSYGAWTELIERAIGTWGDDELLPNDFEYDEEWHDEDMSRLADLIDRPTCFDIESKDSNSFTCSACGFSESKLVVQPFSLDFCYIKPNYHYCPNCGKEIVNNNR